MTAKAEITDGSGAKFRAKVTRFNQLVTAPLEYSEAFEASANSIDIGFEIVPGLTCAFFVITDIFLSADRDVSPTTPAVVQLYEADPTDLNTVISPIITENLIRNQGVNANGLNIITKGGANSIVLRTDDNVINATVAGYYVPCEII